jgi:hypothetical protein
MICGETKRSHGVATSYSVSGAIYHVMNRGASRQKAFLDKQDYEAFLMTLNSRRTRSFATVWAASDGFANKRFDP